MSFSDVIFALICWFCALAMGAVALWAFKRRDPMHFWSGSTVKPEEIRDIPAYNRANGFMWTIYAVCMVVVGVISLFSTKIGTIVLLVIVIPGFAVIIVAYNRIYNKYRNTSFINSGYTSKSKIQRAVIRVTVVLTVIISLAICAELYFGSKEPVVTIGDNRVQIQGMYGISVESSEISNIELIEKSMVDIGVGTRINGYGGLGETLKGNFKSDSLGETLLFVQSKSSPTIKIERTGKKDVYISFRDSTKTEQLYNELEIFHANLRLKR